MARTLFLALGLLVSQLNAQPIITRSDMPSIGDTTRVMNATAGLSLNAKLGIKGEQQRWDFTDLQSTESELVRFQTPTETPYFFFVLANAQGIKFADSINLFLLNLENVYDFYNLNNSRYATVGRGVTVQGFPLPAQYSDPDELYFFPLQFGRSDSSTFAYGLSIPNTGGYSSRGGRKTEVDGWGEVITPFGRYSCLRVKSTVQMQDSISINGLDIALPIRTEIEYKWLAKGEKVPVLSIRGNSVFGSFSPTSIRYRYNYPQIVPPTSFMLEPGELIIYPNPTQDLVFFGMNALDKMDRIQAFDLYGRVIMDHSGTLEYLDVSDWNAGVYSLRIWAQYGVQEKRLVVFKK